MPLWRLVVAYDGSRFLGFQRQARGRTVQGELERAILDLTGSFSLVRGASRTDSGVHALGQVVAFESGMNLPAHKWPGALNARLERDLVVMRAEAAPPGFDPQRHALQKTYRYLLDPSPSPQPVYRHLAMHAPFPLDLDSMGQAAKGIVGTKDFRSFSGEAKRNTVRTVFSLEILQKGDLVEIRITANGFLYHMVRNIVGTLIEIGRGKRDADVERILRGKDRSLAGATAPAKGLTLVEVRYAPDLDRPGSLKDSERAVSDEEDDL